MQAMIFAAGKGTRLKPLTDVIPKAMVPVGDIPLLQRVYSKLVEAGCDHIVMNVHHHAPQLVNYAQLLAAKYGIEIIISDESDKLLETGGGIKKARTLFNNEPLLIHNCDILSNVDLREFYRQAASPVFGSTDSGQRPASGQRTVSGQRPADATLLVSERKTQRYLLFDDTMRLVGWKNIATGELKGKEGTKMFAFSGIHCLNTTMFQLMDQWPDAFPIMDFYLKHCSEMNIRGILKSDLRLLDVGKLDTLAAASDFLSQ